MRSESLMSGRPRRRLGALLAVVAALAAVAVPATSSAAAPAHGPAHGEPRAAVPSTVVIDGARLRDARDRFRHGDRAVRAAVQSLQVQADSWLGQGPWTVTDKPQ